MLVFYMYGHGHTEHDVQYTLYRMILWIHGGSNMLKITLTIARMNGL